MLLTREELVLDILKDFNVYEVIAEIKGTTMEFNSLNDLISYAGVNNINSLLFNYDYINEESLSIVNESFEKLRLDNKTISIVKEEIDEYNKGLKDLDYSKPVILEVYCIHNGITFYFADRDYWFLKLGYSHPTEACMKIVEKYENKIKDMFSKESERVRKGRSKLEETIMADTNFYNCSNKSLRRKYAIELVDGRKIDKSLFYREQGGLIDYSIETYLDYIWKKYKEDIEAYIKLNSRK